MKTPGEASRTGRAAPRATCKQYKKTKGSPLAPKDYLSLYCEVQTTNLRAKIGNFCLTTKGYAEKEIAEHVGVHVTTIYREINRNSTPSGKYIYHKSPRDCIGTPQTHDN